jgi:hypothetical protein
VSVPSDKRSVTSWLPTIQQELACSTWEDYERKVRNHVLPHLGRIPLQTFDATALTPFYTHLLEHGRFLGKQSAGLKLRAVRCIHTVVHAARHDVVNGAASSSIRQFG